MSTGKRYRFFGSSVEVQTGFGSPKTVTNITAANPPVVTAAAHGFVLGDVVKLESIDAPSQLDDLTTPIDNPDTNDFEIPNVNGTGYDAFDAGTPNATATPVEFSEFCELTGADKAGAAANQEDVSTICSDALEFEQGLSGPGSLTLNFNWAGNEEVQTALEEAEISGEKLAFRVSFGANAAGGRRILIGTVQQTSFSGSTGQAVWKGSAQIQLSGRMFRL